MSEAKSGFNMKYVHFAVTFAFMFLFRFVPPVGTITPYGMAIIGIFIGLIYAIIVGVGGLLDQNGTIISAGTYVLFTLLVPYIVFDRLL